MVAQKSHSMQHPIILPRRDYLVELLCRQVHLDNMYLGPSGMMEVLAQQYHIIGVKQLVCDLSKSCVPCRR